MNLSQPRRTKTKPTQIRTAQISLTSEEIKRSKTLSEGSLSRSDSFDPYEGLDTDLLGFDPNAVFEGTSSKNSIFSSEF